MNARDSAEVGSRKPAGSPRVPNALLATVLLALAAATLFGWLGEAVQDREPIPVDTGASQFLHGYSSPPLDAAMRLASFLGSAGFVIPCVALVLVWLLRRHRVGEAVFLPTAYAGSGLLNHLLKLSFQRGRPQLPWSAGPSDFSFPSGHAMNSLVFYFGLGLVAWLVLGRRVGLAVLAGGVVMVLLVGLSRVYFGYHYVSDVLGGYSAGLLWLIVYAVAFRLISNQVGGRLGDRFWSRFG